jgi:hypothetical protein
MDGAYYKELIAKNNGRMMPGNHPIKYVGPIDVRDPWGNICGVRYKYACTRCGVEFTFTGRPSDSGKEFGVSYVYSCEEWKLYLMHRALS